MPERSISAVLARSSVDLAWFATDEAHALIEWAYDEWDKLSSAERQRYDGWIGEFLLAVLSDACNYPKRSITGVT